MNKSSYKAAVNPFKHAVLKKPNKSNSEDKHESQRNCTVYFWTHVPDQL